MIIQDCNGVNPIRLARANGICMRDRLSGSSQGLYCSPCTYSQFPAHAFQHIRRTGRNSGSSGGPGLNYLVLITWSNWTRVESESKLRIGWMTLFPLGGGCIISK